MYLISKKSSPSNGCKQEMVGQKFQLSDVTMLLHRIRTRMRGFKSFQRKMQSVSRSLFHAYTAVTVAHKQYGFHLICQADSQHET